MADAILGYVYYGVFDSVSAGVTDGVAVLQGSVLNEYRRDQLLDRVARVPGLRDMKSEIRVQPVSFFDDRLRRELYYKIYGNRNGLFVRFANAVNPPGADHRGERPGHAHGLRGHHARADRPRPHCPGHFGLQVDNQVQLDGDRHKEEARATTKADPLRVLNS